jgi:hypothetical protein
VVLRRVLLRKPKRRPRQQVGSVTASFGGDNRPSEAVTKPVGSGPIEPILPCGRPDGLGTHPGGLGQSPIETGARMPSQRSHLQRLAHQPAICSALLARRPSAAPCSPAGHLQRLAHQPAICSALLASRPSAAPCSPAGHLRRQACKVGSAPVCDRRAARELEGVSSLARRARPADGPGADDPRQDLATPVLRARRGHVEIPDHRALARGAPGPAAALRAEAHRLKCSTERAYWDSTLPSGLAAPVSSACVSREEPGAHPSRSRMSSSRFRMSAFALALSKSP